MLFSLGKIFLSDKEIIPLDHYNAPWHTKTGTNDTTLQYKLGPFQTSEKPKTDISINVIYKLMYL